MFTADAYETQIETARAVERHRIAALLRRRAEDHPKWEVHALLTELAQEIEDAGKTD